MTVDRPTTDLFTGYFPNQGHMNYSVQRTVNNLRSIREEEWQQTLNLPS